MQGTKVIRNITMPDKLKEIKNNNKTNLTQNQSQYKNQNLNETNNQSEISTNKIIKLNQQVNPKRSKSKNGSRKETSTTKIKISSNTNIPYVPTGQKNFDFSLNNKTQNSFKKTNKDDLMKKKTSQRNSTSKDFKGDKTIQHSKTEIFNFNNTKNFKLKTIDDFYSNTELAGNFNSNLNSKNLKFSKDEAPTPTSYDIEYDDYSQEADENFTKKIYISNYNVYEIKKNNNNFQNLNNKQKKSKNYINNLNTMDQNMRNTDDHYNNASYEINKKYGNKSTPPKFNNNNEYDDDYQMLEESMHENNGNINDSKINEIKNIKIQKKNQKKKKSLNDSDGENNEICPANLKSNANNDLIDININNNDKIIFNPKNNIISKKNSTNNNIKVVPLGNRGGENLNLNKSKSIEAYFPKENKNLTKKPPQKLEENFYEHNDSLENEDLDLVNKEDEINCNQEEDMMVIEESFNTTLPQPQAQMVQMVPEFIKININNFSQQNANALNSLESHKENIQPQSYDITFNANLDNNIDNKNDLASNYNNENENLNQGHGQGLNPQNQNQNSINTQANNQTQNQVDNSRYIPILAKYENQIPLEYIPDIWKTLKSSEMSEPCKPHFDQICGQRDINFDMRAILIDWIVEVHKNYRLLHETLFITISIIDRYLSLKNINRTKLQLLGTTALFIASKYEEIVYPCLTEFSNITDSAYDKEEILEMEKEILKTLDFDITYPSSFRFFEIISLNYNFSEVEFYYGCFLMEYFLLSSNHTKYYPSIIALAVVLLILRLKKYDNYRDLYNLTDPENQRLIKECAREIYEFPARCRIYNLNSVNTKYSSPTFHCVAVYQMENSVMPLPGNNNTNNSEGENKENKDPNLNDN